MTGAATRRAGLAIALLMALAAWTARADGLPSAATVAAARALIFEKAQFWAGRGRQDLSLELYMRLLETTPQDTVALAGAVRSALAVANPFAADGFLARLRAAAPDDPELAKLLRVRNRPPDFSLALAEARRLAGLAGHTDEAVAAYRKLMPDGEVPDDLAGEFYPLLISSLPDQSVDANDALTAFGAVAARSPGDDRLQLAYARAMIVQEGTRAEGFEKLHALSKGSSVASEARTAWRAALLWQGADFAAQAQLETYLKENPTDPELEAKREEFRASLPSEGAWARIHAYEAMRANQMAEAEKQFDAALAFDPKDVDAMIMIAAIRVQQGRRAEAHSLTEQAIALAPERRAELLGIVGEDPETNARAAAAAAHAVAGRYEEITRLTRQGNYDQAEAKLRRLMGARPNAGDLLLLADIEARAGQLEPAAATLGKALQLEPHNGDAAAAMAAVQTRQGRTQEAAASYAQAEDDYTRAGNRAGLAALRQTRAAALRAKAEEAHDPQAQLPLLRAALAIDPDDPWLRLQLARVLRKTGASADAQAVMYVVTADAPAAAKPIRPKPERVKAVSPAPGEDAALEAGFIWAQESGDLKQEAAFVDRVPPSARTPAMIEVLARAALAEDLSHAINPKDRAGTRMRLLALAAHPDPDGQRGAQIARAAIRFGDTEGAERIIFAALDATQGPTPQQRLSYAGVMLEAELPDIAQQMIEGMTPAQLPPGQRAALPEMLDSVAAARADALTKTGKLEEAHKLLAPRLAENPGSARLNLSLSRWQTASGHPDAGLAVSETVMQRDPADVWARHTAIDAAVAANQLARAQALVADALKSFPDDAYLLMQAATIATARDEGGRALDLLHKAKSLRARQLAAEQ